MVNKFVKITITILAKHFQTRDTFNNPFNNTLANMALNNLFEIQQSRNVRKYRDKKFRIFFLPSSQRLKRAKVKKS